MHAEDSPLLTVWIHVSVLTSSRLLVSNCRGLLLLVWPDIYADWFSLPVLWVQVMDFTQMGHKRPWPPLSVAVCHLAGLSVGILCQSKITFPHIMHLACSVVCRQFYIRDDLCIVYYFSASKVLQKPKPAGVFLDCICSCMLNPTSHTQLADIFIGQVLCVGGEFIEKGQWCMLS